MRSTVVQDICLFTTFLLDLAVGVVCALFLAKGWNVGDYDDSYLVTLYAAVFNALNVAAFAAYYRLGFALCELHLCVCAFRVGLALSLAINALMTVYGRLDKQAHAAGARLEFELLWLFTFSFSALCNALLVHGLHPKLRGRKARPARARPPRAAPAP